MMAFIDEFQIDVTLHDYIDYILYNINTFNKYYLIEKLECLIEMSLEFQPKHYHYALALGPKIINLMIKHGADKKILLDSILESASLKYGELLENLHIFSDADIDFNEAFKKYYTKKKIDKLIYFIVLSIIY